MAALAGFAIGYWRGGRLGEQLGIVAGLGFGLWLAFPYLMALGPGLDLVDVSDNEADRRIVARVLQVSWVGIGVAGLVVFMVGILQV